MSYKHDAWSGATERTSIIKDQGISAALGGDIEVGPLGALFCPDGVHLSHKSEAFGEVQHERRSHARSGVLVHDMSRSSADAEYPASRQVSVAESQTCGSVRFGAQVLMSDASTASGHHPRRSRRTAFQRLRASGRIERSAVLKSISTDTADAMHNDQRLEVDICSNCDDPMTSSARSRCAKAHPVSQRARTSEPATWFRSSGVVRVAAVATWSTHRCASDNTPSRARFQGQDAERSRTERAAEFGVLGGSGLRAWCERLQLLDAVRKKGYIVL